MKSLRLSSVLAVSLVLLAGNLSAQTLVLLGDSNLLYMVDRETPGAVLSEIAVTGLDMGETLLGIDVRPATGELYGLGSNGRLYVIELRTGVAVPVGTGFATALSGTAFGFDFNPTVDRIRIISNSGQNLRAHPTTGAVVFVDGTLAFASTDVNAGTLPQAAGAAYTNSFAGTTSTTLYDLDSNLDILVTQIPPNSGVLNTIGSLGMDIDAVLGFDIVAAGNVALAAVRPAGIPAATSTLVSIDLATGAATSLGNFSLSGPVRGLAVLAVSGVSAFGTSTPGCQGPLAIAVDSAPRLGNADFGVLVGNAAPSMPGFVAVSDQMLAQPISMSGALAFIDLGSPSLITQLFATNAQGVATSDFSIPSAPGLLGMTAFLQAAVGDACAPAGIAATKALAISFLP